MKPAEIARETLRRAVELQVLEPEDVSAAGSLLQDPRELVDALKAEKLLSDGVEAALAKLIEKRPAGARGGSITKKGQIELGGGSATLAPSRKDEPPPGEPTPDTRRSGVRDYEAARIQLGDAGSSTMAPAREATPVVEKDPGGSTVAPLGDSPRQATGSGRVSGIELGGGSSTLSPMRSGDEQPLFVPLSTGGGRGADESLLDLSVLEPDDRRAIESAAFCRIALRMGKVTRDQIAAAHAQGGAVEEKLLESGAIDQPAAMDIFAVRASVRAACGNCFGILPLGQDPAKGCPTCGQLQTGATSSSRLQSATLSDGGGGAHGIEGFPGQGGLFAGYELLERIAEGGMGVVFKARQTKLNRVVALKVMRGGSLANKERRRRFRQEAESAAALRHPCIVPVHEIDEVKGYPFYTMEFVEGVTMDRYTVDKKLEPKKVSALVRGVADAVQHFHLRGIIHRDLKPGNILVGEDGVPKIIDFGIAKKLVPDSDSSTIEGEVLGTPYYMSPEQATGRVTEVDTRTDVYALGAILYELLTGAPPWKGLRQARLIAAIQEEDPEPIRPKNAAVEQDLESIVLKAMSKERERRYQSAADLAADLERYESHVPVTARPATLGYRVKKYVRRHLPQVVATAIVVTVIGTVVGAAVAKASATRREVASLLEIAQDKSKPMTTREASVAEALGKAPGDAAAVALRDGLAAERQVAEAKQREQQMAELQKEREKAAAAEAEAKAEHANQELRSAKAAEQARLDTEKKAKADAEARAKALLDQATKKGQVAALDAIPDLQEALVVVPKDSTALRAKIENEKIDLELALAREQIVKNQTGLARFWLGDAQRLESSKARAADFAKLEDDLKKLESGEKELDRLHDLVAKADWLLAKPLLDQLKKLGIDPARLAADQGSIEKGCGQRAAQLVAEGRTLLGKGEPANGLAKALEAQQFETSEAVKALLADCEREDALAARRLAAEDWKRPETQKGALVVLAQAAARVQTPGLKASLEKERSARARLLDDRSLVGLCFVPAVPDLGVAACYVERTEVTNADFKQFVDAGGYGMADLWQGVPADVQATFKDGCPGGTCTHKGPRTWTNGGFGDPANADRPVRGVTIHEARAYARWKSKQSGGEWRLPQESEWEVAAGFDPRTQRLAQYPWGDEWSASALTLAGDLPRPAATTSGDVSALGVADAGGNVMEWVDRKDGQPGTKGASFAASEAVARRFALVRSTGTPGASPPAELLEWIGFRLVRTVEGER